MDVTDEVSLLSSRMGGMALGSRDVVMVVPIGLWLPADEDVERRAFSVIAICIAICIAVKIEAHFAVETCIVTPFCVSS